MLANLLPGFRHVRTPLATGYIYAFAVWLILGADRLIPNDEDAGAARRVSQLVELVGTTATLAAVSFAAYLIGSMLTIRHSPFGMSLVNRPNHALNYVEVSSWATGSVGWIYDVADRLGGRVTYDSVRNDPTIPSDFLITLSRIFRESRDIQFNAYVEFYDDIDHLDADEFKELLASWRVREQQLGSEPIPDDALVMPSEPDGSIGADRESDWWDFEKQTGTIPHEELSEALLRNLDQEVARIAAGLQVQSEYVFNDYDRIQSEAELRYSISVPLAAVMIISAVTWHLWALVGLVLPIILVVQAFRSERSSIRIILSAVQFGVVESPTAEALRGISIPARSGQAHRRKIERKPAQRDPEVF